MARKYRKRSTPKQTTNSTLCWRCKNATNSGCDWSREFKPVEGWKATPTMICGGEQDDVVRWTPSYHVHSCPEFISDIPYIR